MWQARWQGVLLAESDACVELEGNIYFPPSAIHAGHFVNSPTTTTCPWKGVAHYYHLVVNGQTNPDAAWYYPAPKDAAEHIKDHIAFWEDVEVIKL